MFVIVLKHAAPVSSIIGSPLRFRPGEAAESLSVREKAANLPQPGTALMRQDLARPY